MNTAVGLAAVAAVCAATALIGIYGLRISRTTGDFYVASRTVKPWWNASAIGGEYLSAASFLGVAGLILHLGHRRPVVPRRLHRRLPDAAAVRRRSAAPLRRLHHSGLRRRPGSIPRAARRVTSLLVVVVGWLYIVPQLHGAALTIRITTGLPGWAGAVVVVVVVVLTVVTGGMRSITFVQAFQYWLKLTALAVPVVFILLVLTGAGQSAHRRRRGLRPGAGRSGGAALYRNISLIVALLFGTLGLPHVLVRFYTNPDGAAARRTTLMVLGLLSLFYLFPTVYGVLGRLHRPGLRAAASPMPRCCCCRGGLWAGSAGDLLSALVVAGAFAAFLSTTSGLVVSLAGVISQDLFGGSVGVSGWPRCRRPSSRWASRWDRIAGRWPAAWALVFAFTASTICPLLLLGIWWRGLTDAGAIAGMVTGGVLCGGRCWRPPWPGRRWARWAEPLAQPAAWTVPAAFLVTVLVSLATAAPQAARGPGDGAAARARNVPEVRTRPAPGSPAAAASGPRRWRATGPQPGPRAG